MFLEQSSTNHMNFVQTAEFDYHGNQKDKFAKKYYKKSSQKPHKGHDAETLQKCS